jgi:hypothetical protein
VSGRAVPRFTDRTLIPVSRTKGGPGFWTKANWNLKDEPPFPSVRNIGAVRGFERRATRLLSMRVGPDTASVSSNLQGGAVFPDLGNSGVRARSYGVASVKDERTEPGRADIMTKPECGVGTATDQEAAL